MNHPPYLSTHFCYMHIVTQTTTLKRDPPPLLPEVTPSTTTLPHQVTARPGGVVPQELCGFKQYHAYLVSTLSCQSSCSFKTLSATSTESSIHPIQLWFYDPAMSIYHFVAQNLYTPLVSYCHLIWHSQIRTKISFSGKCSNSTLEFYA